MSAPTHDLFSRANSGRDQIVGGEDDSSDRRERGRKSDQVVVPLEEQIRRLIIDIWPSKTAAQLAIHADVTVRQAQRILARDQGISFAGICRLLQSDHGERFLWLLMGNAKPDWWREVGLERQISKLAKEERAAAKRRAELERAAGR